MPRPTLRSTAKVASPTLLVLFGLALPLGLAFTAPGQQTVLPGSPIGRTSAKTVQVSGAVGVRNGELLLGNGSAITAGDQPVAISLTRGGELRLCQTTAVHLSHDLSINAPDSSALMMALDRGALEANYETGKYSDVLFTPDFRFLISGPGHADLRIRVNGRGDTCVENRGPNAPYITVTSQLDGGLYRIQPGQHVTLEHGSLTDVLDTEREPCGCPAGTSLSANADKAGGASSTAPADTEFPLAVSEGLAPAAGLSTVPAAQPGQVHVQVSVPFTSDGSQTAPATRPETTASSVPVASTPAPTTGNAIPPSAKAAKPGIFHRLGHFFSHIFGSAST